MTLITHFRNKNIAVIAGDSQTNHVNNFKTHGASKVFKLNDGVIGISGDSTNPIVRKLLDLKNELKKDISIRELLNNLYEETKNHLIEIRGLCFFVIALKNTSKFITIPPLDNITELNLNTEPPKEFSDKSLRKAVSERIFFSPLFFDEIENKTLIYNLHLNKFSEIFKEIYNIELNLDIIKDDDDLKLLLTKFYESVGNEPQLHWNCIDGNCNFYCIEL